MPALRMRVAAELLKLPQRHRGGLLVCLDDAMVIHRDRQNRHRLGRRADEVEVEPTVPELLRGESFTGHRVQIVAEAQEYFAGDSLTWLQTQPSRADANPMTTLIVRQHFTLGVVIVVRQVLVEIRRGGDSILLWDGAEHGWGAYRNRAVKLFRNGNNIPRVRVVI